MMANDYVWFEDSWPCGEYDDSCDDDENHYRAMDCEVDYDEAYEEDEDD